MEHTRRRRSALTPIVLVARTSFQTLATLRHHRLGSLVPLVCVLLLLSATLWVVNTIAPLAPFVYSLF